MIVIAFVSLAISTFMVLLSNTKENPIPVLTASGIPAPELPVRLKIPSINVNSAIQYVGVNSAGEMATPSNVFEVGWYKLGVIPGEKGSAVIAGHLDGQKGEVGVFSNLSKLKIGDELYVEGNKGRQIAFAVRAIHLAEPGYVEEVFMASDSAHLNLVTCGGVWKKDDKSYSKRLIVFADKE